MAAPAAAPDASGDLSALSYKDTRWLEERGWPVTPELALDYFMTSPFCERENNNAVLRMQFDYSAGSLTPEKMREKLKQMTGVEYEVTTCAQPIVVLRKQRRSGPETVEPLATYYILNGVIFQAPSLQRLFNARLMMSLFHLQSALSEVYSHVVHDPITSYAWAGAAAPTVAEADHLKSLQLRGNVEAVLQQLAQQPLATAAETPISTPSGDFKREVAKPVLKPLSRSGTGSPMPVAAPAAAAAAGAAAPAATTAGTANAIAAPVPVAPVPVAAAAAAAKRTKRSGDLPTPPPKRSRPSTPSQRR